MTYKELEMYLEEIGISKMDFCRETGISRKLLLMPKIGADTLAHPLCRKWKPL